ncbi:hypothetical protein SAMN05444412_12214 [Rhodonellum ikkaensis]|nr:hypothetical protein SAMN05444412_12214 [Rhodonellum ikkaensis]
MKLTKSSIRSLLIQNTEEMKKLAFYLLMAVVLVSCQPEEEQKYTSNKLEYALYQGSEFDYQGKVNVRELANGSLELSIVLSGKKDAGEYFFPTHLHFGGFDSPDAPIAHLLNPVNIKDLKSETVLGPLSDGRNLTFSDFKNFDGHIKVHLADSGPEYGVILSVGNVGNNDNSLDAFNREMITVCSPYLGN